MTIHFSLLSSMNIVLLPINLVTESVITLKPKEHQYERSRLIFDIEIKQMDFHIDSKQISDVLDFVKFQKYTTIYGIIIFNDLS